jgi:5-methylcytosine-specific restriction protein A
MREALFRRNPLCVLCAQAGFTRLATQRDHIKPLFEGGEDADENTQGLCDECHDGKSLQERIRAHHRGAT